MRFGFHKVDITPRIGVELQGYGPYLNRHSDGIRDRLFARAMAVEQSGQRAVVVSCDLIGVSAALTSTVRALIASTTGLEPQRVMLHATHTHSGPALPMYTGWGTPDPPYLEILPRRIALAATQALADLTDGTLFHAETPCTGIAINREYDSFRASSVEAALADDWQPAHPELTDTTCHVFKVLSAGRLRGFFSYYGCHPVVSGSQSRKIHGDYAGVATNRVEQQHPGAVGLFLQGAQGDINSAVVSTEEPAALQALAVIAGRYERAVLAGLEAAVELPAEAVRCATRTVVFSRKRWDRAKITTLLHEQEALLHAPAADDGNNDLRLAMVRSLALRTIGARMDAGLPLATASELQGVRIGPVALLGTPLEVFRNIKNDAVQRTRSALPLVLGFTNDSIGYAIDRTTAAKGGYAADLVPLICQQLPFANIHAELADGLAALDADLHS